MYGYYFRYIHNYTGQTTANDIICLNHILSAHQQIHYKLRCTRVSCNLSVCTINEYNTESFIPHHYWQLGFHYDYTGWQMGQTTNTTTKNTATTWHICWSSLQLNAWLGGWRCCPCCLETCKDMIQRVMSLLSMLRVQREPHSNSTTLAGLHCLHSMVVAGIEANHATTLRHHWRLLQNTIHTRYVWIRN